MKNLLTALQSRFTAASLNTTITGGLHLHVAPRRATVPYVTLRMAASPATQTYGSAGGYSEPQVSFFVTGVDANDTLVLAEALRDAYKNQVLTITSGVMLNTVLVTDPFPGEAFPIQDESGNDLFEWIVTFRFSING